MKNLVRGGVILSILGMFVAVIYAQTLTEDVLSIAKDSQTQFNNIGIEASLVNKIEFRADEEEEVQDPVKPQEQEKVQNQTKEQKKLVEKTVLTKAASSNRGSFIATAYCLRGRTATGSGVRKGIIAADPRVLRLGSRVNLTGGGYSGSYVVADTGGRIKGKKIDIWVPSCAEARRFGRRTVNINVQN
jgi:3D (Asp-Asp-Asp) domain-containing protein